MMSVCYIGSESGTGQFQLQIRLYQTPFMQPCILCKYT